MPDQTPKREILPPEHIDRVADAVLAVARELWTLADRQMVLEEVLRRKGVDIADDIDRFQPDDAFQARLDKRRDEIIAAVSKAFSGES